MFARCRRFESITFRLIQYNVLLICFASVTQSRTPFLPANHKLTALDVLPANHKVFRYNRIPYNRKVVTIDKHFRNRPHKKKYVFDEAEDEFNQGVQSTAMSVYPDSDYRDNFNDFSNEIDYPMIPSHKTVGFSTVHHIPVTDHSLVHIGLKIASSLKYILIALLAFGLPIVLMQMIVIPLKLLITLKMIAFAKIISLAVLAAKLFTKYKQHWGGWNGGYGAAGGLFGGLTPILASNIQQPIAQPITQLISNPVQQWQNGGGWPGYGYPGYPWWWHNCSTTTETNSNTTATTVAPGNTTRSYLI